MATEHITRHLSIADLDVPAISRLYSALAAQAKNASDLWRIQVEPKTFAISTGSKSLTKFIPKAAAETALAASLLLSIDLEFTEDRIETLCKDIPFLGFINLFTQRHKPTSSQQFNHRLATLRDLVGTDLNAFLAIIGTDRGSTLNSLNRKLDSYNHVPLDLEQSPSVHSIFAVAENGVEWLATDTDASIARFGAELRQLNNDSLIIVLEQEVNEAGEIVRKAPIDVWSPEPDMNLDFARELIPAPLGSDWYLSLNQHKVAPEPKLRKPSRAKPRVMEPYLANQDVYSLGNYEPSIEAEYDPYAMNSFLRLSESAMEAKAEGLSARIEYLTERKQLVVTFPREDKLPVETFRFPDIGETRIDMIRANDVYRIASGAIELWKIPKDSASDFLHIHEGVAAWLEGDKPDWDWAAEALDPETSIKLALYRLATELIRSSLAGTTSKWLDNQLRLSRHSFNQSEEELSDSEIFSRTLLGSYQYAHSRSNNERIFLISKDTKNSFEAPADVIFWAIKNVETIQGRWVVVDPDSKTYYQVGSWKPSAKQVETLTRYATDPELAKADKPNLVLATGVSSVKPALGEALRFIR